ncbi:unnamed protein product [Lampetra planeri]
MEHGDSCACRSPEGHARIVGAGGHGVKAQHGQGNVSRARSSQLASHWRGSRRAASQPRGLSANAAPATARPR